jgi:alkyl hydroperoxide reductase subunit AhpF
MLETDDPRVRCCARARCATTVDLMNLQHRQTHPREQARRADRDSERQLAPEQRESVHRRTMETNVPEQNYRNKGVAYCDSPAVQGQKSSGDRRW